MAKAKRYGIEIISNGEVLTEYAHEGKVYFAAPEGQEYQIRLTGPGYERTEAVVSVDGLSIMTGEDASSKERGYVFTGSMDAKGFRLNDDEVAAFYFGERGDSYADKIGKPSNVGVIAVKFFSEEPVFRALESSTRRSATRGGQTKGGDAGLESMEHDVGTGFGKRTEDQVGRTTFDRKRTEATIVIEYASEEKLREKGIITDAPLGEVDPFPGDKKKKKITGAQPPEGWDD